MPTHDRRLSPSKFQDPDRTAEGKRRASVRLRALETLWFNTGTLCNLTCRGCYIGSSPTNDRLVHLGAGEVRAFLDEVNREALPVTEIGFTGGEPFVNPDLLEMMRDSLARGFRVLVLTNAMRPMWRVRGELRALGDEYGERLTVRVSIDHYTRERHESLRGAGSWEPMVRGLRWLARQRSALAVAGRTVSKEPSLSLRAGYAALFAKLGVLVNAWDPAELVLFPEMNAALDVPEITEACWDQLGVEPGSLMCASSRMVVKHKGDDHPTVTPCTLLVDDRFSMGPTLAEAKGRVRLDHPHCARFCVLGGGSCGP